MQGYSDYYCLLPGAMRNGRSVEPSMIDGNILGSQLANLRAPYMAVPTGLVVYDADYKWIQIAAVNAYGTEVEAECLAAGTEAALLGETPLTMGQALGGRAARWPAQRGRAGLAEHPAGEPQRTSGTVSGVVATVNGVSSLVNATGGVIIAAGGFEHNAAMRTQYLPSPTSTSWTLGADTNTGDGIQAGLAVGAAVALMDQAWWGPVLATPDQPYFCLAERTEPGGLIVNQAGQRFVDEAAPYGDVVNAMYNAEPDRAGHSLLADRRPELPRPVPVRRDPANAAAAVVLVQRGHGVLVGDDRRAGERDRRARRQPGGHHHPVQRLRRDRRGLRLQPGRQLLRPLLHRPRDHPELVPRAAVAAAVLRVPDAAR